MDPAKLGNPFSLIACGTWLLSHRILLNRGFVLTRKHLSTDTLISLLIGSTASLWSLSITIEAREPCKLALSTAAYQDIFISEDLLTCLAQAARTPLLLQILFACWILAWIDGVWADRVRRAKPHLWSLNHVNGPFDWISGVHYAFYLFLCGAMIVVILIPSIAAIIVDDTIYGVLNILGLALFIVNGTTNNPYTQARHRYADDSLRIALPTSHHEGTMYILPSINVGMDAVWSPKIQSEHQEADAQIMTLFSHMRSGQWSLAEPLQRLRLTTARYQERVVISPSQLNLLARFIYNDRTRSPVTSNCKRKIECARAPNTHLIGRDLMYALCHAEYLVFMGQTRLAEPFRSKLGTLRLMSRSGASPPNNSADLKPIGWANGLAGYRTAAQYIYTIFDEALDESAVTFSDRGNSTTATPLLSSRALGKTPSTTEEYVGDLWDLSCQHTESLFSALYMFTTVWAMEQGNRDGFHLFPLQCRDREGDLVSQQIVWRQAWYAGVTAQLVSASPLFFGAFVLGYLQ